MPVYQTIASSNFYLLCDLKNYRKKIKTIKFICSTSILTVDISLFSLEGSLSVHNTSLFLALFSNNSSNPHLTPQTPFHKRTNDIHRYLCEPAYQKTRIYYLTAANNCIWKRPIVFHSIPKWQNINSKTVFPSSQYVRGIHEAPGGTVLQWREMALAVPGDTDDWLFWHS